MKKTAGFLLVMAIAMIGISMTCYAGEKKLGTGDIGNPDPTNGKGWSYVYYGKYTGKGENVEERAVYTPEKYRVLSKETTDFSREDNGIREKTMLLDCDRILFDKAFHLEDPWPNAWADSDIRTWLNKGNTFYGNGNVFTAAERAAIAESRTEYATGYTTANGRDYEITNIDGNHVFLLDVSEAVNADYGYVNNDSRKKNGGENSYWWLRSPLKVDSHDAGFVSEDGEIILRTVSNEDVGVSPAFNVNLESVIFTSEITSEPGSFKLTLSDNELGIKVTEGKNATRTGNGISVPYTITGSNATNATQVSVLITDEEYSRGTVAEDGFWYHKIAGVEDSRVSGTGYFTLPARYRNGTWGEDYYVYLLAEDVNGEKETDYASLPVPLAVPVDSEKEITGFRAGNISDPSVGWNYVYYGKYDGDPVRYRVLSKETTDFSREENGIRAKTMLLDCDRILFDKAFHLEDPWPNAWADSDIRTWLNKGNTFYGNGNVFTAAERAAIAESRTEYAPGYTTANGWDYEITNIDGDHVFLLDASEAVKADYGYVDNDSRKKNGGEYSYWWLRSPIIRYIAGFVNEDGRISRRDVSNEDVGVSPAFNVNLESVIFTSEITSEPGSFKLTLSDNELGIKVTEGKNATRTGNRISVPYTITGNHASNVNQISVLVTDKKIISDSGRFVPDSAEIKQYGKLDVEGDLGASGTGTFTLDTTKVTGTQGSDYFIYILAEEVNGGIETDYAGVPVEIAERKTISYDVTFKVKNGSWDDGTTADKKVTLSGWEDEDLALMLKADQIPAVGNKPAEGCKAGGWDRTPDTDTAITADTAYVYAYVKNDDPPAPAEHGITVKKAGQGTASADRASAAKDTVITLAALPDEGWHFVKWEAVAPAGLNINDNTFTMPDEDVEIKAVFEKDEPEPTPVPVDKTEYKTLDTGGLTLNGMALNIRLYGPKNKVSYNGMMHVKKGTVLSGKQKRKITADLDIGIEGVPGFVTVDFTYGKTKDASEGKAYFAARLLADKASASYNALGNEEKKKLKMDIKKVNKVLKQKKNRVYFTIDKLDLSGFAYDSEKSSGGRKVFIRKDGSGDQLILGRKTKKYIDPETFTIKTTTRTVLKASISGNTVTISKKDYKKTGSGGEIRVMGKNRNLTGTTGK